MEQLLGSLGIAGVLAAALWRLHERCTERYEKITDQYLAAQQTGLGQYAHLAAQVETTLEEIAARESEAALRATLEHKELFEALKKYNGHNPTA